MSLWRVVIESLKGHHHDFTSAPMNRAVLLLAIPMVLEMIMESLFAVVDVFFVSHLGKDAIAVVGLTESVMSLIYAVAIGISFAATSMVSRRIGEKNPEMAARTAAQIVLLGFLTASGIGVVGAWFAEDIMRLMGASENVVVIVTDVGVSPIAWISGRHCGPLVEPGGCHRFECRWSRRGLPRSRHRARS